MGGTASSAERKTLSSLERVAKILKDENSKNLYIDTASRVIVMAGAGISTSAGIPDFRSPVTGLYASLEKFNLPYPEALFDISYFLSNPKPFYTLYSELYPDGAKYRPTLTHCFLRLLEQKGKLLRIFTQNIDALEQLVGLKEENIVEAHGSFANARCVKCKVPVDKDWLEQKVKKGIVARCEQCPSHKGRLAPPIKPDITFFGENLPERFFERLYDFRRADLLLVMGTSLVVQPFASLIDEVPLSCPRALLNLEKVGERQRKFSLVRDDYEGFDFDDKHTRDMFCQGKLDETVRKLAQLCGWEDDLDAVYKEMNKAMDLRAVRDKRSTLEQSRDPDLDADQLVAKMKATRLDDSSVEKL